MTTNQEPICLVAMGGHAFIQEKEIGTNDDHRRNAAAISARLVSLVQRGYNLVITHGNGPQVGNLLRQNEMTREVVPSMPMDVLVAETQGSLGYTLQQSLLNELQRRNMRRYVSAMICEVVVDRDDPAFLEPTKPVGPFMTEEQAAECQKRYGWRVTEVPNKGMRRVVASPRPLRVIQRETIREAALAGHIAIAAGGGGIPVIQNREGVFEGVEAVVDKDLTSAVLANQIGAQLLIILTAVSNVYTGFGTKDQRPLSAVTLEEIRKLIEAGEFPRGSMGPKIQAVTRFLEQGGQRALITDAATLPDALEGRGGTHFVGRW